MQRDRWGKWAIIIAFAVIATAAISLIISMQNRHVPVTLGAGISYARVVADDSSREKGLSGTKSLAENESMLFVFDIPGRWGMWMKNMHYSIDIVWMDRDKKIIHTAHRVAPETYPKVFLPQKDALYVLELPAGYLETHGVAVGQVVTFSLR